MLSSVPELAKNMSSTKMLLCLALAVLSISSINGTPSANYLDAARLAQSCPELDHCNYDDASSGNKQERRCSCAYSCSKFGDCCVDAPRMKINEIDMKCYDVSGVGGVYMVGRCPESYDGVTDWREMCEDTEIADPSDPVGTMPITDYETGVTYKNVYCKMCNGKMNLTCFWNPKVECPLLPLFNESSTFTEDFVLRNLVMDQGAWGLNINQGAGKDFFLDCFISPAVPFAFKDKVRKCNPDLVSDCPPSWKNEKVRAKCLSYLGPRFAEDRIGYKNMHCAICNGADLAELSCQGPDFDPSDLFRFSAMHSFALLMDINERLGSRVGMIKMCEKEDVYDPFFHRCRTLQCFPGFVRRGMRCVRRQRARKIFRKVRPTTSTSPPFTSTTDAPSTSTEMYETTKIHNTSDGFLSTNSFSSTYAPSSTIHDIASRSDTTATSDVTESSSTTTVPSVESQTVSASSSSVPESSDTDMMDFSASTTSLLISKLLTSDASSGDVVE